jgi:hypothetical protein
MYKILRLVKWKYLNSKNNTAAGTKREGLKHSAIFCIAAKKFNLPKSRIAYKK